MDVAINIYVIGKMLGNMHQ